MTFQNKLNIILIQKNEMQNLTYENENLMMGISQQH